MAKEKSVRELRLMYGNPYAYIEHLEEAAAAPRSDVSESRKLLGNPYAYLDEDGGFAAATESKETVALVEQLLNRYRPAQLTPSPSKPGNHLPVYSSDDIEGKVHALHRHLWREKAQLWPNGVPRDPIDMLDPAVALAMLGYTVNYPLGGLGQFHTGQGTVEVAGIIDSSSRSVRVSGMLSAEVERFTLAHELGHAVLHPDALEVHRDRPLDGLHTSKERHERDADRFAKLWLMPPKLVVAEFRNAFSTERFELNTDTAFGLTGKTYEEVLREYQTRRQLSRLLASQGHYAGRHFQPLAARFRVSVEAMAIRLEELGLVCDT